MTYTHKDIKITFDESRAEFSATVGGRMVRSPSLQAIKSRIDKNKDENFQPFSAFVFERFSKSKVKRVEIIAKESVRKRRFACDYWRDDHGQTHREVMKDTPENKKAIDAYLAKRKEAAETSERLSNQASDLDDKIERLACE